MARGRKDFLPDKEDAGHEEVKEVGVEGTEDLESVKKELEEAKEQAGEYLANWQRAEADFINYKRRNEQERAEIASFANASLIKDLLPVLDDFERALENVSDDFDGPTWVDGIRLIHRKLKAVLEERGLSEIEAEGGAFDPNLHEAVMCVDGEEGKVCEEIQKGYRLRDRLLRPSMVKVGKEGSESAEG
ncbi:MAG: nucleotide exchange factor GrpE [Chloroflexi bacterium]|nr:MAG: nucleotide exchange factor GrpE [Chloroflexota bacterium]